MNLRAGQVQLPRGYWLSPTTTRTEFLNSDDGTDAKLVSDLAGWWRYYSGTLVLGEVQWGCAVAFRGERIALVSLFRNAGMHSWEDQATVDPYVEQKLNTEWLEKQIGTQPPWVFTWGNVSSGIDTKNISAKVYLEYPANREGC